MLHKPYHQGTKWLQQHYYKRLTHLVAADASNNERTSYLHRQTASEGFQRVSVQYSKHPLVQCRYANQRSILPQKNGSVVEVVTVCASQAVGKGWQKDQYAEHDRAIQLVGT